MAQSVHTPEVLAPTVAEKVPATQVMHEEARLAPTVSEYVPVGQLTHTERAADGLYAPLAHITQVELELAPVTAE